MQIVPDNLNIRTGYHVFETPEDICINSQVYDKITMEPKPYNFFNTNQCLNNKNLLLHECNILEYGWAMMMREHDYEYYIQDNQNPEIFYVITEVSETDDDQYLLIIQKSENGWKLKKQLQPDSGQRQGGYSYYAPRSTYFHYKLIGQTDEYIILTQHNTGLSEYNYHGDAARNLSLTYVMINKNNYSVKSLNVGFYNNCCAFKLKEESNFIYIYEYYDGNINIIRLDPYTNTRIIFHNINNVGGWDSIGISNIILFRNKYYILTRNNDKNGYAFRILTINFEYDTVSSVIKNIPNISGFPYHNATRRADDLDCSWLQIDLKNVDDTYISITVHDNRNCQHGYIYCGDYTYWRNHGTTYNSSQGYHRHALYKYDSTNDSWISKGIITPDEFDQHIYGVIYYDQYTPIFFTNKRIIGYRLDLTTEKYNKCFEVPGTFYTIGLDENNKFYTFDNSNVCHIYNDVTSYLLDVQFEKSSYNYNNADIPTYVTIYSKNFVNEYIKTKVKITIEGNCKFTSNGKKELVTYTDANGPINVDVTVTYGGTMYCYIKEVE